ncbi:MAG: phosphate signaling complex protein PhoU [Actinomycetota bacterium]
MTELRRSFHTELGEVHAELMRIGARVTEAIPRATRVLLDMDLEGADYMIQGDDELDARCVEVEEHCYRILALQAPVASDLRAVITALKMTAELERSGDLAVNICKAARRIYGHELNPKLRGVIAKMSEQAQQLFANAMVAYDESDPAKAAALDDMDNFLDALQRQFIQVIFESHAAGSIDLQVAVQLGVVARFYERIGDHAVNIGEKVRFLVSGWMPAHVGAGRHRLRQDGTPIAGIPIPTQADRNHDS